MRREPKKERGRTLQRRNPEQNMDASLESKFETDVPCTPTAISGVPPPGRGHPHPGNCAITYPRQGRP